MEDNTDERIQQLLRSVTVLLLEKLEAAIKSGSGLETEMWLEIYNSFAENTQE